MTFEGVRKNLVEENNVMTDKELKKYCINLFLSCFFFGGTIIFSVGCILNTACAVVLAVLMGLFYIWLLDLSVEEPEFLVKARKVSKLWFLGVLLFIGMYVTLVYFGFY